MDWGTGVEISIALLVALSGVPYLIDVFAGRTVPQRMSWVVFTALAASATVAQVAEHGVTGGSILTGVSAVEFSLIAIASISHGTGGTSPTDITVLIGLAVVLPIWIAIGNHPIMLPLLIVVEIPTVVVTVVKVIHRPGTESWSAWTMDGAAGLLAIAVAPAFDSSMLYPAYNTSVNMAVLGAIWWTRPSRQWRSVLAVPSPPRVRRPGPATVSGGASGRTSGSGPASAPT